ARPSCILRTSTATPPLAKGHQPSYAELIDPFHPRSRSMFHQFHFLLVRRLAWFALAAAVLLWTESPILAQGRGQTTETKSGTIVEIQKKGRGRVLTVEIDGQQHSVPVTPKLDLQIIAQGDAGFVRPGQFLTATATLSNNKLFVQSLTIQPVQRGQKPPAGKI